MFLGIKLNREGGKEQEQLDDIQVFNASKATDIYWPKKKTLQIISGKIIFSS